tara:strand:+ start:2352 stop:4196 length:1845 start_codon:yes stop_codon:yes gene_type:complete
MTAFRDKFFKSFIIMVCWTILTILFMNVSVNAQLKLQRPTPAVDLNENNLGGTKRLPNTQNNSKNKGLLETPSTIAVEPPPADQSGITVNQLEVIDPDAVGLISDDQGGFSENLWEGTDWSFVAAFISRLPITYRSWVLRELGIRLLISRAVVPAGKPGETSFLAVRASKLLEMGELERATALLNSVGSLHKDENLELARVENRFMNNDNSGACNRVRTAISDYTGLYWSQAQAFCLSLSGDHARAALIADLVRETGDPVEPVFFSALDALAGVNDIQVPTLKSPKALHFSMMRTANLRVPTNFVGRTPVMLRMIALAPNAKLEFRLQSAEKATLLGALTPDKLLNLYRSIPFTYEELKSPMSTAEEHWGPRSRALLLRAAAAQDIPLARAEVLRRAWQLSEEHQNYKEMALASTGLVSEMKPTSKLGWFAANAARVLFSGGKVEQGLSWCDVLYPEYMITDEMDEAAVSLWPLAVLADPRGFFKPSDEALKKWRASLGKELDHNGFYKLTLFFALLEALEKPVSEPAWEFLKTGSFSGQERPLNINWERALSRASSEGRIGEAILLVLAGDGERGNMKFAPRDASQIVRSLKMFGLDREARLFALETVMAVGF